MGILHYKAGENHHAWKGDSVGYKALHDWVRRKRGTPNTCEHCGKSGFNIHQIHWANKSHEYKRELDDWIRLCVHCHHLYDKSTTDAFKYSPVGRINGEKQKEAARIGQLNRWEKWRENRANELL